MPTSPISAVPKDLQRVLDAGWGVVGVPHVEVLKCDRVWSLRLPDGRCAILKDWGVKDGGLEARVAFYQDVMDHVVRCGVTAEVKLRTRAGGHIHRQDGHAFTLGLALPVDDSVLDAAATARLQRAYGVALGQLHHALASYPQADARARTWCKDVPAETQQALETLKASPSEHYRRLLDSLPGADPVETLVLTPLRAIPQQLILFDCHPGNLLRVGDRVSGFIDYDHLSIGQRIWDLGNFVGQEDLLKRLDGAEAIKEWSHHTQTLLDGYAQAHPLSASERSAVWSSMVADLVLALPDGSDTRAQELLSMISSLGQVRHFFV